MTAFDRTAARAVLEARLPVRGHAWGPWIEGTLDELEACVEPDGWNAIMRMLGTYYPESIFPQRVRDSDWGNGPQVVSLLRLLNAAEERIARIRALCDSDGLDVEGGDGFLMTSDVRAALEASS